MTLPSADHLFYIPIILVIGFILGFVFGRKSLIRQMEERREMLRRRKERQKAKAEGEASESDTSASPSGEMSD
jgi:hypothetical protein